MKGVHLVLVGLVAAMLASPAAAGTAAPGQAGGRAAPAGIIVAQVKVADLGLAVTARCDGETVIFNLVNRGETWPDVGSIMILRGSDRSVLNRRTMRLAADQSASFKLLPTKNPGGEVGLFVAPTWYVRPFAFDARVSCK